MSDVGIGGSEARSGVLLPSLSRVGYNADGGIGGGEARFGISDGGIWYVPRASSWHRLGSGGVSIVRKTRGLVYRLLGPMSCREVAVGIGWALVVVKSSMIRFRLCLRVEKLRLRRVLSNGYKVDVGGQIWTILGSV